MVREKTEEDFVIDLSEFEHEYALKNRVNPCLTRPLQLYRGLALGAVQGALMDPYIADGFQKRHMRWVRDVLSDEIEEIVSKSDRILADEKDEVCHYLTELIIHIALVILQRHPGPKQSPGLYDVTIKPYTGVPYGPNCVGFNLVLTKPRELDPQPTLGDDRVHKCAISLKFPYGSQEDQMLDQRYKRFAQVNREHTGNYGDLPTPALRKFEIYKGLGEGIMGVAGQIVDDDTIDDEERERRLFRFVKDRPVFDETKFRPRLQLGELIEHDQTDKVDHDHSQQPATPQTLLDARTRW